MGRETKLKICIMDRNKKPADTIWRINMVLSFSSELKGTDMSITSSSGTFSSSGVLFVGDLLGDWYLLTFFWETSLIFERFSLISSVFILSLISSRFKFLIFSGRWGMARIKDPIRENNLIMMLPNWLNNPMNEPQIS